MDKLEEYLDQVCRGIGGARALRQHIRQELGEHLRDAAAEHRSAGLAEDMALARALEDFGGPEQVRTELAATHGQRLMTVMIDKAIEWKEKTMKAKWLWASWALSALLIVIVLELLWITFAAIFLVPKFQYWQERWLNFRELHDQGAAWMPWFLNELKNITRYTTWMLLVTAGAWGLFEWRVRSENKPLIRLSALGTAAVVLMVVSVLAAASLVIPLFVGLPAMAPVSRPFALEQLAHIETSVKAVEQGLEKKDWDLAELHANRTYEALNRLDTTVAALAPLNESPSAGELRMHLRSAEQALIEASVAVGNRQTNRVEAALEKFRKAYEPVREAAKRPAR